MLVYARGGWGGQCSNLGSSNSSLMMLPHGRERAALHLSEITVKDEPEDPFFLCTSILPPLIASLCNTAVG